MPCRSNRFRRFFLLHARSIRLVFLPEQSDLQATEHLNAMNRLRHVPWKLSFSFGLALQAPVLKACKGDPVNTTDAQRAFHHRAWCNTKARFGKYTMENDKAVL
jgi:fructose-bisphosphate aldolase, class I